MPLRAVARAGAVFSGFKWLIYRVLLGACLTRFGVKFGELLGYLL